MYSLSNFILREYNTFRRHNQLVLNIIFPGYNANYFTGIFVHGNILRSFILLYPAGHNIIVNNRSFYFNPIGLTPFEPRDCRALFVCKKYPQTFPCLRILLFC